MFLVAPCSKGQPPNIGLRDLSVSQDRIPGMGILCFASFQTGIFVGIILFYQRVFDGRNLFLCRNQKHQEIECYLLTFPDLKSLQVLGMTLFTIEFIKIWRNANVEKMFSIYIRIFGCAFTNNNYTVN